MVKLKELEPMIVLPIPGVSINHPVESDLWGIAREKLPGHDLGSKESFSHLKVA